MKIVDSYSFKMAQSKAAIASICGKHHWEEAMSLLKVAYGYDIKNRKG